MTGQPGGDAIAAGPETVGGSLAIIARPATLADRDDLARLLVATFPREFGFLFARTDVAEAVVAHVLDCDFPDGVGAWVACLRDSADGSEGAAIGILLLESPPQFHSQRSPQLAWHILWKHVGLWGLPRLAFGALMPGYSARPGEVYVRAIGVDTRFRRRGVAALLLRCAEEWGQQERKAWLGLHVHSENDPAHALYYRLGYVDRGYRQSLATRIALGQRGHYYMTRPLRENGDKAAQG